MILEKKILESFTIKKGILFIKTLYIYDMVLNIETAAKIAEFLLQIKAVKLSVEDPCIWSSGIKSPIYCDNRIVLSYPPIRNYIRETMAKHIEKQYLYIL